MTKLQSLLLFWLLQMGITLNAQDPEQTVFADTTIKGMALIDFREQHKIISFSNCTFEPILHVSSIDADTLLFTNCIFEKSITLNSKRTNVLSFVNCSFRDNSEIYFVGIDSSIANIVRKFEFSDSLPNKILFVNATSIDTLDFWRVKGLNHDISITGIIPTKEKGCNTCQTTIRIYPDVADKYVFDYSKYSLEIPPYLDALGFQRNIIPVAYSDSFRLFSKLLEGQKKNFFMEGSEKADIDLHETRLRHYYHFDDLLSKYLWNYTYDKERVFIWAFLFFLIFLAINFLFIRFLSSEVFEVERIKQKLEDEYAFSYFSSNGWTTLKRLWHRLALSFFYTAYIFWSIEIKIDKFKYRHYFWTFYIYLVYIIGLVCTAFVASYVYLKLT